MFRKPVEKASQGDRCGICIGNFDAKQFERGIVCEPNHIKTAYGLIVSLKKIKHFKGQIESGSKFHITIGHETVIGKIELFGLLENSSDEFNFDFGKDYLYLDEYQSDDQSKQEAKKIAKQFAFIDFTNDVTSVESSGVLCSANSLLIGSKLDTDIHLNQCRIAFDAHVLHAFCNKDFKETSPTNLSKSAATASTQFYCLNNLRVYKEKSKEGQVERKQDEYTIIGKSLFKKETNMDLFVGLKVSLSTGEKGVIEGSFGQSGKLKVRIPGEIKLFLK